MCVYRVSRGLLVPGVGVTYVTEDSRPLVVLKKLPCVVRIPPRRGRLWVNSDSIDKEVGR